MHPSYFLRNGQQVASVTTKLAILNKPALLKWAWECGKAGLDFRVERDEAGDIGTQVHEAIISYLFLYGKRDWYSCQSLIDYLDNPDLVHPSVFSCFLKFKQWWVSHDVKPLFLETPFVSELDKFGGMPDFIGRIDGEMTILDFKTGKAIYDEMFYQLAGYFLLVAEAGIEVKQCRILRLPKKGTGYEDRIMTGAELRYAVPVFLACSELYDNIKQFQRHRR